MESQLIHKPQGLVNRVQGVMNTMTMGMGESGRRAANALAAIEAVTTAATETATKTQPVKSAMKYIVNTVLS